MAYANPSSFDFNERPANHRQDTDPRVYKAISPVPLDDLTPQEADQLRGAALVWLNRGAAKEPLYLKTHCANITLDHDLALIPKALTESVLYLIRDPRDIAVSFADHLGKPIETVVEIMGDTNRVIKHSAVRQIVGSWSLNVQSWVQPIEFSRFILRYEDLFEDPEKWFRQILKFYEIKVDAVRFADALLATNFRNLQAWETRSGYKNRSPVQKAFFREGRSGGWRDTLSPEIAATIERAHGSVMRDYGYL